MSTHLFQRLSVRNYTSSSKPSIASLLQKPTWSIRSLLPPSSPSTSKESQPQPPIAHLLTLSALPIPSNTNPILSTLQSQLHFVRAIQTIDTSNVPPLPSIRDETTAGIQEQTITLSNPAIRRALEQEQLVGKWKRPQRQKPSRKQIEEEQQETAKKLGVPPNWDVLGNATEKFGGYFVVRSGKEGKEGKVVKE
ncbi:hypothetical protein QBC43DRAFT_21707 [Cladorrhinum sp. PSN259]|nr:hypothetical protein QBC43DRAFT_21707 [Cladorrhinum sp. PSN259]